MMTDKETKKVFYEALKAETKRRKIKLSSQVDIYKKDCRYQNGGTA